MKDHMDNTHIAAEIRDFIRRQFNVPDNDPDFNDDVHLFDYGYVDSFGAVSLTTFVETTFSIKIDQADMIVFPLNTVNEIATFAAKRQKGEL
jgi:methoxymalonate biosynthesis acyl carrier protein